jgi:hypothetical protein
MELSIRPSLLFWIDYYKKVKRRNPLYLYYYYLEEWIMNHEQYMDIKFILSIWDTDIERGKELSGGERWFIRNMFKKMNDRQRWDTIDGNHEMTKVLMEEGLVKYDKERGYIYREDELNPKAPLRKDTYKRKKFLGLF